MNKLIRGFCSIGSSLLLLGAGLGMFPAAAEAETYTENGITYSVISNGAEIVGAEADSKKLTIPTETDAGDKVRSIAENAFSGCSALEELKIEKGIENIGDGAFSQCGALKTVNIPDSVTKIGKGAFYYCLALESLKIPDSVTEIGDYAFSNCYALREIELPRGLRTLPAYALSYDIGLESLKLPDGMQTVSDMSLVNCMSLKTLELPASLVEISSYAVLSCMGLEEIVVDSANKMYRTNDDGCLVTKDAKTFVLYPAGRNEETAVVPEGIETVQPYAFSGALSLKEVRFANSVKTIGDGCFADCRMLELVSLPNNLEQIPPSMFANCETLKTVSMPETVKSLGDYAFYCSGLTEITLPAVLQTVGSYAFCGCNALPAVNVPKTVTSIGDMAFGYRVEQREDGSSTPAVDPAFVLHGTPSSAAKSYAQSAGIKFKQHGLDWQTVLIILAAAAVLLIAVFAVRGRKHKQKPAESEVPAPEETDPNYISMFDDADGEDGDPYDRSYGFGADEDDEDAADDETADETGADADTE